MPFQPALSCWQEPSPRFWFGPRRKTPDRQCLQTGSPALAVAYNCLCFASCQPFAKHLFVPQQAVCARSTSNRQLQKELPVDSGRAPLCFRRRCRDLREASTRTVLHFAMRSLPLHGFHTCGGPVHVALDLGDFKAKQENIPALYSCKTSAALDLEGPGWEASRRAEWFAQGGLAPPGEVSERYSWAVPAHGVGRCSTSKEQRGD